MPSNYWVIIALAVVVFGAGWTANGWRLAAELAEQGERHEKERWEMLSAARAAESAAINRLHAEMIRGAEIATEYLETINEARNANDQLRAAVESGRQRLSVAGRCAASSSGVSGAAATTGGTDGASVELDPAARPHYFDLRDAIERDRAKIAGLQRWINSVCRGRAGVPRSLQ